MRALIGFTSVAVFFAAAMPLHAAAITRTVWPGDTDPNIDPVDLPNADGVALPKHFVAVDPAADPVDRLFLWLPGSGGAPTQYQALTSTAARLGYDAMGLVYDSWPPVYVFTTNSPDPELPEALRRERIFGEDLVPDPVSVDPDNSIVNRVEKLLEHQAAAYPDERWGNYLLSEGGVDWSRVVVAGHSQGAGHTAYLSKEFLLSGAVMIAGPGDFVQDFGVAPWLLEPGATPAERLFALTHVQDPTAAGFFANQRLLGLDDFGALQNVDGLAAGQITSHMLTSTLDPGNTNYHSTVAVDDVLPLGSNGEPLYLPAWTSMFRRAAIGEPLAGDYDRNGLVDGADYTVWRDAFGATGPNYAGDGNGDGVVDTLDYEVWAAAFANAALPDSQGIPEPTAMLCIVAASTTLIATRRKGR
ncbi:MAG: hypothetical protein AAFV43_04020 [Planctomycetota bacterium]